MDAPARTLDYGSAATLAAPLGSPGPAAPTEGADTLAQAATAFAGEGGAGAVATLAPLSSLTRTTVLPQIDGEGGEVRLRVEARTRYEPMKLLGAGGMGEVVLVQDQDIARRVAVKRLLPELGTAPVLARFVDEIRTVGRLEHPNIVPIHDVGVDELGRYFFVMKYVEGETLESVIDKLAAGDPAYVAEYSYEKRIEVFLGILHALEYAHAHGIVHRDVKPANVMIGRYGEVVLMDWGIAKPLEQKRDAAAGADAEIDVEGSSRGRMFATRMGALIGTPAYMSPEQARGENDRVDLRSDLFSAALLFHELISLRHCLADAQTVDGLVARLATKQLTFGDLFHAHHPKVPPPPGELLRFVHRGVALDPAKRFQDAGEMIGRLEDILEGKVHVECAVTLTKRIARELGRFVDRHPFAALATMVGLVGAVLFSLVMIVRIAVA
jgi:serine/threonine-protein kinase